MKNDLFNQFKEEGLRIVDEDGVSFESIEENELYHQEMADLNIDHGSELAACRAEEEAVKEEYEIYKQLHVYGMPLSHENRRFNTGFIRKIYNP